MQKPVWLGLILIGVPLAVAAYFAPGLALLAAVIVIPVIMGIAMRRRTTPSDSAPSGPIKQNPYAPPPPPTTRVSQLTPDPSNPPFIVKLGVAILSSLVFAFTFLITCSGTGALLSVIERGNSGFGDFAAVLVGVVMGGIVARWAYVQGIGKR